MSTRVSRLSLRLVVLLACAYDVASQNIITVGPGLPVSSIQQAIGLAANQSVVRVQPGTYIENISFLGKAITVESTSGPGVTLIDGNNVDSVASFVTGEGNSSVLRGFQITNGGQGSASSAGAGIWLSNASPTIEDCIIHGNRGSGIRGNGAPVIRNCRIAYNTGAAGLTGRNAGCYFCGFGPFCFFAAEAGGPGRAGGVDVDGAITMINSWIVRNTGGAGGTGGQGFATLPTCSTVTTSAGGNGGMGGPGGVTLHGGTLFNCTVADNVGGSGGAGGLGPVTNGGAGPIGPGAIGAASVFGTTAFSGIRNSIVWGNSLPSFNVQAIFLPLVSCDYCILQPSTSGPAVNHTSYQDPQFLDAPQADYHLTPTSPAINAGLNAYVSGVQDIDGAPRIYDGTVDLGASEWLPHAFAGAAQVLSVNGNRIFAPLALGTPFTLRLDVPSPSPTNPRFVIAWSPGIPGPSAGFTLPGIGSLAIPVPNLLASPPALLVASLPVPGGSILTAPPGPWTLPVLQGLAMPVEITLQGIIEDATYYSTTNAVILKVN